MPVKATKPIELTYHNQKLYYALPPSNSKMLVFLRDTGHYGVRDAGCNALRYMLRSEWGTKAIVGGDLLHGNFTQQGSSS